MNTADPEVFRQVYETAPMILHAIDRGGRLTFVSDLWCEFHGVAREDAIGRLSTFDFTEESKRYAESIVADFMTTGFAKDIAYTVLTPNGRREILMSATAIRDADGVVQLSVACTTDVTEIMSQGRRLGHINDSLRYLALGFAHDMGGPAANAGGCVDAATLLQKKLDDLPPDHPSVPKLQEQRDTFTRMASEALAALRARSNSVEQFMSVVTGDGHLVRTDLNAAFADGLRLANGPLTDIPVDCPELPTVMAAPSFSGVFQNILSNSAKYAHPSRPIRIDVECERVGEFWQIRLSDNGIGFDSEKARKVFQPGYRIKSVAQPGQGFGLASARQLVIASGGEIHADSQPGVGSTFTIELPVHEASPAN